MGSTRSFGFVGFIRAHLGAPWGSLSSFGCVVSVSLGSFERALGVVGLIIVRCVHLGALWLSSGSFEFVGFIPARSVGNRVHSGSLSSFGAPRVSLGSITCTLGVVGFIRVVDFIGVHSGAPLCSFRLALGVIPGSFGRALEIVRFIQVHSGAPLESEGSYRRALGVVGFISFLWVYLGEPLGSEG